jgi:hypothetical protein
MDATTGFSAADSTEPAQRVRLPIELSPTLQRRLARWCRETAQVLDVPTLTRADVVDTLLNYLLEDQSAAAEVQSRLTGGAGRARPGHV